MKESCLILVSLVFGVITADYVGPQNGFTQFRNNNGNGNGHGNGNGNGHGNGNGFANGHGNGNGNGNGNSYGVPPDSFNPPPEQGPSGPYPPSGWKPAGRRLLLPGESREGDHSIDSGYGQPPPPQYGPAVNPAPTRPPINNQYGPSVDNTPPPNNQYIPGSGNGGNGFTNGNGHNGGNGNGNHNGFSNGNHQNGQNGSNGSGNGVGGNGFSNNGNGGNGFTNGNGQSFGNGQNGNGFSNGGNGVSNGANGNGQNGAKDSNGKSPSFHNSFPIQGSGGIYPFVQLSVPATIAVVGPSTGTNTENTYPIFNVPVPQPTTTTGIIPSFPSILDSGSVFPLSQSGNPYSFFQSSQNSDFGSIYPVVQLPITGTPDVTTNYPAIITHGGSSLGNGIGQFYTLLSNTHSQKSNILGVRNGASNLRLQYTIAHPTYSNGGVPSQLF